MKPLLLTLILLGCNPQSWDNVDFELYRIGEDIPDGEPLTTPEIELIRGRWRPFMDEAVRKTGEQLDPTKRWADFGATDSSNRGIPMRTNECDYDSIDTFVWIGWASPKRPTSDWRPITAEDLESYLKECWDDSTRHDRTVEGENFTMKFTVRYTVDTVDTNIAVEVLPSSMTLGDLNYRAPIPERKARFYHTHRFTQEQLAPLQGFSDYLKER